jgi:2-amino-4-hydroxy-6-hydroxymethyldihydropteridine diphosphokinase
MPRAWIALGSNVGPREANLAFALEELGRSRSVELLRRSSWIETAPVGGPPGQDPYLNGVAEIETTLAPRALLALLQSIERGAGRLRIVRDGPRTLDLDLLLYEDQRIDSPDLVVPHPRMEERAFVLEPLAELAPELVLAGCGRTVRERLVELHQRAL